MFARAYLITFLFHLFNHSVPLFCQHFASHLTSFFFDFLLPSSHDFIRPNSLPLRLLFLTNNFVSCILCCHFSCFGHFSHLFSPTVLTSPFLIFILQSGDTSFSLPHLIFTCHHFEMAHPPYCFVTSCLSFLYSHHQTATLLIIM